MVLTKVDDVGILKTQDGLYKRYPVKYIKFNLSNQEEDYDVRFSEL